MTTVFQASRFVGDNVAHVGISKIVPLVAGTSYVFGAALASNVPETVANGGCNGIVVIGKQ